MSEHYPDDHDGTDVTTELQQQPHLLIQLAENALTVAESLRGNYFRNTARFIGDLRRAIARDLSKPPEQRLLDVHSVADASWSDVHGEVVTFIDGGIGQVRISGQVPILLRVGSYSVRTGERRLAQREQFGYYPVLLGDLEGGSKERKDFVDIVRITAELLACLSALQRTPDLRVLMLHGPLVYQVGAYSGHTPFTEADIDRLLHHYAASEEVGRQLKADFLELARRELYPAMLRSAAATWIERRYFEPLAWMAFLFRRLVDLARSRDAVPVVAGVVERGMMRDFCERVLLARVFERLRRNGRLDYLHDVYGRTDLTSPRGVLDRLGYTDGLLLGILLRPGQYSEPWEIEKYDGLRHAEATLPHSDQTVRVNYEPLRPGRSLCSFPRVHGCYVAVTETMEPLRVELFHALGAAQVEAAARRVYLYARLLPGYAFPVGLDIVDRYAHVPAWLTEAYGKLIRYHLGTSLQTGEITDAELRRILVQAIYMTQRDWLFRPALNRIGARHSPDTRRYQPDE